MSSTGTVVVITGNDIRKVVGSSLYDPITFFKPLAETLHQAMEGNTTSLVDNMMRFSQLPHLEDACAANSSASRAPSRPEAQSAVVCGDGDDITGKDAAWWLEYVNKQMNLSQVFGSYWVNIRFSCSSWPFRPNWSFKGPFKTPKSDSDLTAGHPAAPLLFLSARLDPVTPLSAARAMASNHPGAGFVIQESMGHCTIPTAPSNCTRNIVADYFEFGTVPSEETTCETQCGPWDENCGNYPSASGHLQDSPGRMRMFPLGVS